MSNRLKKAITKGFYVISFLITVAIFLVAYMPANIVNSFLDKKQFAFGKLSGTIHEGSFKQIIVNDKYHDLDCNYKRELSFSYRVICLDPTKISFNVIIYGAESFIIENLNIKGDMQDSSSLLEIMSFPKYINDKLSGKYDFFVKSADISNGQLINLDLSGEITKLTFNMNPSPNSRKSNNQLINKDSNVDNNILSVFDKINITTKQTSEPITIATIGTGSIGMDITTTIDENKYKTLGIIKGKQLDKYSQILRFFGKPLTRNEWQIELVGAM